MNRLSKTLFRTTIAALALGIAGSASAATVNFTGALSPFATDPRYLRPVANGNSAPTDLAFDPFDVKFAYVVVPFTVSEVGFYNFLASSQDFDTYLGLHSGSFDPTDGLLNALIYDDDNGPESNSAFSPFLSDGIDYFAVVTSFFNNGSGAFTLTISGPGDIIGPFDAPPTVPEPASWALMIAGFGLVGSAMRRRTTMRVTYARSRYGKGENGHPCYRLTRGEGDCDSIPLPAPFANDQGPHYASASSASLCALCAKPF
jgi:PEP-CTERM motif